MREKLKRGVGKCFGVWGSNGGRDVGKCERVWGSVRGGVGCVGKCVEVWEKC